MVNVLKFQYIPTSGSKLQPELVQRFFHQGPIIMFRHLWLPALSKILSILNDTVSTVNEYFSVFKAAFGQRITAGIGWMSETDRQSTVLKSKGLQMSSLSNSSLTKLEIGNGRLNTIFG